MVPAAGARDDVVEIGLEYSNQVANAVLDTEAAPASASWAAHAKNPSIALASSPSRS